METENKSGMYALLLDTVSIQQYVFGSNKLKENIGASYIIENELFNFGNVLQETEYNLGYKGGGNAMLLFSDKDKRNQFKKQYFNYVLSNFPGIRIAFGEIDNFDPNNNYKNCKTLLIHSLIRNKSLSHLEIVPFKLGIVDDCPLSNEGIETEFDKKDISYVSKVKYDYAEISNAKLNDKYPNLERAYHFTDKIDNLGQPDEKGYVAIIHADGNGIGNLFMNASTLEETQKLAEAMKEIADKVMQQLYVDIATFHNELVPENGFNLNNYTMPIRELLAAGDDFALICEGKLGVYIAKRLVELFSSTATEILNANQFKTTNIGACAGVAIVHTHFPFYKAYTLAEELCKAAKTDSRNKSPDEQCRINFMICSGNITGSLEEIIENNYTAPMGKLFNGSYALGKDKSFEKLLNGVAKMQDTEKFPRSKTMQLRDAMLKSKPEIDYFMAHFTGLKFELPNCKKEIFIDGSTELYDMIELIDFYPKFLIKKND